MDIKILASGSRGNCYLVSDGITPLLLECGIPIDEIEEGSRFGLSLVVACLVSHEHKDHSKAMKDIVKRGIDVYTSAGTIEALGMAGHRIHPVSPREQFKIGPWTILPFAVTHDAAEPLGFLIANQNGERLLYVTDTSYVKYRFGGLTHIMVEVNYSLDLLAESVANIVTDLAVKHRVVQSHMSLDTVKGMLLANDLSQVKEIHLLHLSDAHSDAEAFRRETQELTGKIVKVA